VAVATRLAAVVVAVALLVAGAAAPASGGAVKRSTPAAAKKACAKKPSQRARRSSRRARASAGFRRGAGRGRALLSPRATNPSGAAPGAGAVPIDPIFPGPPAPPAGDPSAPGTTGPVAPVSSTIGAEAYDFGSFVLRLTKASVPAGDLTIYFRNYDVSEHNLWIAAPASSGAAPVLVSEAVGEGGGATKTVAVSPGTWRLYCSLDGHEAMTRDLAVQ
jgi:hypothetical protein